MYGMQVDLERHEFVEILMLKNIKGFHHFEFSCSMSGQSREIFWNLLIYSVSVWKKLHFKMRSDDSEHTVYIPSINEAM